MNSKRNKFLIRVIIFILIVTYLSINVIPDLINKNSNTNKQGIIRNPSDIDLSNSKASIDTLIKTDRIYYDNTGAVPTNKVWSSAIFKGELTGLYTYPFASRTTDGLLQVALPTKQVYERLVTAQISSDFISIKSKDAIDKVYVQSFDDISVTFVFKGSANQDLFTATYVQGSPYIYVTPLQTTLSIDPSQYTLNQINDSWVYSYNDKLIGAFSNGDITQNGNSLDISFEGNLNPYLTLAVANEANLDLIKSLAPNIITSATSEYSFSEDKIIQTYIFNFKDNSQSSTLFGLLPHQYLNSGYNLDGTLFTVNTIRGDQKFVQVNDSKISYSIEKEGMAEEIIPEQLTQGNKELLSDLIEKDLKNITFIRPTTYFGGNDILKLARLLQLAEIAENTNLFDRIKERLASELNEWFTYKEGETSKYFAFDQTLGGIMGFETGGFGEEKYNDHHFQYGYFIHASAILASYDEQFIADYGQIIDLLIKDIANNDKSDTVFPYRRYFDAYEGHSWATGHADILDGNNQESSSEAINAWYGMWKWARVTKDVELENLSEYLYSAEINSTRNYWLNWYNNKSIFPEEYKRNKASLIYGGKFEYQTFFSLEPQSIEAIQYLPITPGSLYLYNFDVLNRDYNSFKDNLKDLTAHLNDFNYLYYAMIKGFSLLDMEKIETMDIDEGQSRANVYYWTLFWDRVEKVEEIKSNEEIRYEVTYKNGSKAVL